MGMFQNPPGYGVTTVLAKIQEINSAEVNKRLFHWILVTVFLYSLDITWCEFAVSKGDGKCDDGNNIPECDYDGGDCCGCTVEAGMCTECQCLDPNNPFSNGNSTNIFNESKTLRYYRVIGDDCCEAHKMYDGKCDGQNNVAFCRYDGYDCCLGDSTGGNSTKVAWIL